MIYLGIVSIAKISLILLTLFTFFIYLYLYVRMHLISCFSLTHLILSFLETNIKTPRTSSERLLHAQLLCCTRGEIFLHIDFTT